MALSGEPLRSFNAHAVFRNIPIASKFISRVATLLIEIVDDRSAFGRKLLNWGETANADALALRAIAGFHALKLSGRAPELLPHYPPNETSDEALRAALEAAISAHDEFLAAYLDRPPQTNEVGRSSMILGGALHVAAATGLPLALYEIGASAGLNLWFADYAYDFGNGVIWGAADAPLIVKSEWSGPPPPLDATIKIASRAASDRDPLQIEDAEDRLRLTSYFWPDQPERLDRVVRALAYAGQHPPVLEKADAADWVEREFSKPTVPGTTRMLYHTVVWQYLAEDTKARIIAAIEKAGANATPEAPLAWFRFENDGGEGGAMDLTLWPGERKIHLGRADFHGRWVRWQ